MTVIEENIKNAEMRIKEIKENSCSLPNNKVLWACMKCVETDGKNCPNAYKAVSIHCNNNKKILGTKID